MSSSWPLWLALLALAGGGVAIVLAGYRLTRVADELADRTGMGEAVAGALLLGAVTSLPGIVTTVVGAAAGDAAFTIANPVGGIAVQTVWLAIADLLYRRANLEHAAASLENVLQTLLLVMMLAVPLVALATPDLRLGPVHPASLAIPVLYLYGLRLLGRMRRTPMWKPVSTPETVVDEPADEEDQSGVALPRLWLSMAGLAVVVGGAGWAVGQAGLAVVAATGLPSGVVGFTLTTAISSVPELVVLVVAVRTGALTLGVGGIIGGNTFDTLMIFGADLVFPGSIYAAAARDGQALLLVGGTLLITALMAAGLLMRDRKGIGFEGFAVPGVYLATVGVVVLTA